MQENTQENVGQDSGQAVETSQPAKQQAPKRSEAKKQAFRSQEKLPATKLALAKDDVQSEPIVGAKQPGDIAKAFLNPTMRRPQPEENLEEIDEDEEDGGFPTEAKAKMPMAEVESGTDDEISENIAPDDDEKRPTKSEDKQKPDIPHHLMRAALRNKWSVEEVEELWDTSPEIATRTFEKLHEAYNNLTNQFSRLASQPEEQPEDEPLVDVPAPAKPRSQSNDRRLDLLNLSKDKIKAIGERYGDDFVEDVLIPMVQPLQEMYHQFAEQKRTAVVNEIDGFFKALPTEYGDLYGNGKDLQPAQTKARQELAQIADQIRSGAAHRGMPLSIPDALERAMYVHARDRIEEITRKRILGKAKGREKQMTIRPSNRRFGGTDGGQKSIDAAKEAYRRKATELGLI